MVNSFSDKWLVEARSLYLAPPPCWRATFLCLWWPGGLFPPFGVRIALLFFPTVVPLVFGLCAYSRLVSEAVCVPGSSRTLVCSGLCFVCWCLGEACNAEVSATGDF